VEVIQYTNGSVTLLTTVDHSFIGNLPGPQATKIENMQKVANSRPQDILDTHVIQPFCFGLSTPGKLEPDINW